MEALPAPSHLGDQTMLSKVISGGQNGVDLAGVAAAKVCGIPTGGWMPNGWWTLDGARPKYGPFFGMEEHPERGYPPRTRANVRDSDATIRIASDFGSAGERCTIRAIKEIDRPHLDIHSDLGNGLDVVAIVVSWIREEEIKQLNVAGNSRKTDPKIGGFAYRLLTGVFHQIGHPIADVGLHQYCLETL